MGAKLMAGRSNRSRRSGFSLGGCRALMLLSTITATPGWAADAPDWFRTIFPPGELSDPPPWKEYEFRLGGLYHGVAGPFPGQERGGIDLAPEFLFPRLPFLSDSTWSFLLPRPHIGGALNFEGKTSYAYAGFAWTLLTPHWFIEPLFGGAIHNGKLYTPDLDRLSLGCRELFHTGMNAGYRLSGEWSLMLTWEHISNGGLCAHNLGLNELGMKVGYSF